MQPEVLTYLKETAQTALNNAHELGQGYMAVLLQNATEFCDQFGVGEETVIEKLNQLITTQQLKN